jgi:diguanylate cyclase (GGDEF)-like protein
MLTTPLLFGDYVVLLRLLIVIFSLFIIMSMIIIYRNYDKLYYLATPILYLTIVVIMFWAVEIALASQIYSGNIMIYLATMLVFGNITIIPWERKLLLFLAPFIWFLIKVTMNITVSAEIVSHLVNSSLILFISIGLSYYIYNLRKSNFKYVETIKHQNQQLLESTLTDGMTGLYNHNHIYSLLQQEINYSKRYQTPLSIILFDIDHFKSINDNYGHIYGDEVIKLVSNSLKMNTRETDYIGRYGGEEFLLILPNTTLEDAFLKAERCRKTIKSLVFKDNKNITISGGVVIWSNESVEQFVEQADVLMYQAKDEGRDKIKQQKNK